MSTPVAVRQARQVLRNARNQLNASGIPLVDIHSSIGEGFSEEQITDALDYMERHGEVYREPKSKAHATYIYRGMPKSHGTKRANVKAKSRHAAKPLAGIERMFARDMPDDCADLPCSPVNIRRIQWPVTAFQDGRAVLTPQHLTSALNALRNDCDSTRVLCSVSGITVIQNALGCTREQAGYLHRALAKLQLVTVVNLGRGKYKTTVEMTSPEVTSELVEQVKAMLFGHKSTKASEQKVTVVHETEVVVRMSEREIPVEPPVVAGNVVEELADIIERLEGHLQELTQKLAEAQAMNAQLQAQLDHRVDVDTRIQDIMSRYNSQSVSA